MGGESTNNDLKELKAGFLGTITKGPFKDDCKEKLSNSLRSDEVKAKEIISHAIYNGYLDACRTFSKNEYRLSLNGKDARIDRLSVKIYNYLFKDEEFEHSKFCECLIIGQDNAMTYGHAQKIVNMTFKYLYCIAEDGLNDKFKPCHMPLDSVMLEWFYRACIKKGELDSSFKKGKMVKWSELEQGANDKIYTYEYYVNKIDNFRNKNKTNNTPLQLDLENWQRMSLILAGEDFLGALGHKKWVKDQGMGYDEGYLRDLMTKIGSVCKEITKKHKKA